MISAQFFLGDCRDVLREMSEKSVNTCVTSPPYFGLRDYGVEGQIGQEPTPDEFVGAMVEVFREVRRVLRDDGTLWLNLGDSYAGTGKSGGGAQGKRWEECGADTEGPRGGKWMPPPAGLKQKDLIGIPWRVAFALQADGWWLRSAIVWHKPNPMPESVTDRPTNSYEMVFLLAKSERYFYDANAVREASEQPDRVRSDKIGGASHKERGQHSEGGLFTGAATRNLRNVWTVATKPFLGAHFATFPPELIEPCIKAGCPEGGTVLDPFGGSGTTAVAASRLGRSSLLIDLNPANVEMAKARHEAETSLSDLDAARAKAQFIAPKNPMPLFDDGGAA